MPDAPTKRGGYLYDDDTTLVSLRLKNRYIRGLDRMAVALSKPGVTRTRNWSANECLRVAMGEPEDYADGLDAGNCEGVKMGTEHGEVG